MASPSNNYYSVMMKDNDNDPKGEMITNLGLLFSIGIVSSVFQGVMAIATGAVAIVGCLHSCCPTGKLPPILPLICVGFAGLVSILATCMQSFVIISWVSSVGAFFTAAGYSYGSAFYTACFVAVIDFIIVSILVVRQEMHCRELVCWK